MAIYVEKDGIMEVSFSKNWDIDTEFGEASGENFYLHDVMIRLGIAGGSSFLWYIDWELCVYMGDQDVHSF